MAHERLDSFLNNNAIPVVKTGLEVIATLQGAGHEATFVGGCVRDSLLGIPPKDVDVTTSARPEEVQALFPRHVAVGARFGVVVVMTKDQQTEVATYREDGGYQDGRRPDSVRFSGRREDAARRDFTINALYYNPITKVLYDDFGGQGDLEQGLIRAIGDGRQRFEEDALRLLRAIRFARRLGFAIEPDSWAALKEKAPGIQRISPERIRDELLLILNGPHPGQALEMLQASGLLTVILPEVAAMKGVDQPPEFHPEGDVFTHTVQVLEKLPENPDPALALAALLHDVGKPPTQTFEDRIRFNHHAQKGAEMADAICQRLRCSNALREEVVRLVSHHMRFIQIQEMRSGKRNSFLLQEDFPLHLALHKADCLGAKGDLSNVDFCQNQLRELRETGRDRPPIVTGKDLLEWGFQEGKKLGQALAQFREAQLEGAFSTKEEARRWGEKQGLL